MGAVLSCARNAPTTSTVGTVAFHGSAWDHPHLSVCWELTSDETETYRREVKDVLTEAYKGTVITFSGWNTCSSEEDTDVRIFVYDDAGSYGKAAYSAIIAELRQEELGFEGALDAGNPSEPSNAELSLGHPRARGFGNQNKGKRANLILNRTFKDAAPGFDKLVSKFSEEGQRFMSLSVAIHEMGHVLGLKHEDGHPDRACSDFKEEARPEDLISPYNPFSIMSRCYYRSYNYNLGYIRPNAKDVEGINAFYAKSNDAEIEK